MFSCFMGFLCRVLSCAKHARETDSADGPDITKMLELLRGRVRDHFSKQVVQSAMHALEDGFNPLRIAFFSTSMRILIDHFMDNHAPPDSVESSPWFRLAPDTDKPTREQRFKYIIQGGLSDTFITNNLKINSRSLRASLIKAYGILNQQIHARETTLITDQSEQDKFAISLLDDIVKFLDMVEQCRDRVLTPIATGLRHTTLQTFLTRSIQDLDELSSRYYINHVEVEDVIVNGIDHDFVTFLVTGYVDVDLQMGSSSDISRGDGAEFNEYFPFESTIKTPVGKPQDLRCAIIHCQVDNQSWYT